MRTTRWLLLTPLILAACSSGSDDTTGVASLEGAEAAAVDDDEQDANDTEGADDAGGAGDADDEGNDAATLEDTEEQMLDFSQCMRDEGVDIGDPVVDAEGNVSFGGFGAGGPGAGEAGEVGRPDEVREAFDTCGEFLDGIQLRGPGGDVDRTALEDSLLEFAQCMRDEGVDMDDPDFSNSGEPGQGAGPIGGFFELLNSDDEDVQAALDVCGDLLAGFGPGARPGRDG